MNEVLNLAKVDFITRVEAVDVLLNAGIEREFGMEKLKGRKVFWQGKWALFNESEWTLVGSRQYVWEHELGSTEVVESLYRAFNGAYIQLDERSDIPPQVVSLSNEDAALWCLNNDVAPPDDLRLLLEARTIDPRSLVEPTSGVPEQASVARPTVALDANSEPPTIEATHRHKTIDDAQVIMKTEEAPVDLDPDQRGVEADAGTRRHFNPDAETRFEAAKKQGEKRGDADAVEPEAGADRAPMDDDDEPVAPAATNSTEATAEAHPEPDGSRSDSYEFSSRENTELETRTGARRVVGRMGAMELGRAFGVPEKRLKSLSVELGRRRNGLPSDAWIEVESCPVNQPRFLYAANHPQVIAVVEEYL